MVYVLSSRNVFIDSNSVKMVKFSECKGGGVLFIAMVAYIVCAICEIVHSN